MLLFSVDRHSVQSPTPTPPRSGKLNLALSSNTKKHNTFALILDPAASINMRQFAVVVVLFFLAGASASPQNLADRIREGLAEAKEGLENVGVEIGRAIEDSPLGEVVGNSKFGL